MNVLRWFLALILVIAILLTPVAQAAPPQIRSSRPTGHGSGITRPQPTPAPVYPDYQDRDQIIASLEETVQKKPNFLTLRLLASEYLKRFREVADVEDLLRAEQAARRSLQVKPQPPKNQVEARLTLASALVAQHRFKDALQQVTQAQRLAPENPAVLAILASIQMELGAFQAAQQNLQILADQPGAGRSSVQVRYLELTGHLSEARQLADRAMQRIDRFYTKPAELRASYHVRSGNLAFKAGDLTLTEQRYREALDLYPKDLEALTGLARLYAAQHRWLEVLQVTTHASDLVPYVELLGYKADAERALDLPDQAAQTEDLIGVVAQLGKAKAIYDRALATYYVEHGIHLKDALLIARKELATRDDLYTEDTLAWALAANGRWPEAQKAIDKALQYGTEDPLLHFHAGLIALQSGDREAARQHLAQALQLNPQFHAQYANQARQTLADLTANT